MPPISILKPLKGTDPEIYESFRSHCLQDYPEYEIIFGVSDPNDSATESVKELQREFPDRRIQLVVSPKILGANVKVSNLAQMMAEARYDHLIVNDSDIRVEPDYLRRVIAPLADSQIGMVTCLYRGVAGATLGSRLEALGISTDFCAERIGGASTRGWHSFWTGLHAGVPPGRVGEDRRLRFIRGSSCRRLRTGKAYCGPGLAVKLSDVVVETYLLPITCWIFSRINCAGHAASATRVLAGISDWFSHLECCGHCWRWWQAEVRFGPGARWRPLFSSLSRSAGRRLGSPEGSAGPKVCLDDSAAGFGCGCGLDREPGWPHRNLARRPFKLRDGKLTRVDS